RRNPMTLAVPASRAARLTVRNPFSGVVIGELAGATPDDVLATTLRARRAAAAFRDSTPAQRRALLNALAARVERDAETLAQTMSAEMGKTITEARNEVRRAQNTLRLSGAAATFLDGEVMHCAIVAG